MLKAKPTHLRRVRIRKPFPLTVLLEYDGDDPSEYKWTAHCPALPACFSEGRTREEAIANVREVVAAYFDLLAENLADKDIEVIEVKVRLTPRTT